eukprot:m.81041 g.81041  ORF g.81041 m.81041 type:complete len:80 (+) comp14562_c0_seq17:1-240(+)
MNRLVGDASLTLLLEIINTKGERVQLCKLPEDEDGDHEDDEDFDDDGVNLASTLNEETESDESSTDAEEHSERTSSPVS